jgi:hypothetical protein
MFLVPSRTNNCDNTLNEFLTDRVFDGMTDDWKDIVDSEKLLAFFTLSNGPTYLCSSTRSQIEY